MEVSSIGAGLPLIVVGIAAIAIAGGGFIGGERGDGGSGGGSGDQASAVLQCPNDLTKSLPRQRIATVESGANAQIIAGPTISKTEPFGLRFTDGGNTVGAMTARFFPETNLFKVQSLVDANCHVGEVQDLASGQGPLTEVPNGTSVRLSLLGRSYTFNLNGGSDIRVNFARFVP